MAKSYTQLREPINNQPLEVLTCGGKPYACPVGMPKKVKILGKHFRVAYHSRIFTMGKVRLCGIVMYGPRLIVIDPSMALSQMRETLYHEMGHIYLHDWQLRFKPLQKLTPTQVEEFCDLFAEAHIDARDNNPA